MLLQTKAQQSQNDALFHACEQFRSTKRLRDMIAMMTRIEHICQENPSLNFYGIGTTYRSYESLADNSMFEQLHRNSFMTWFVDIFKNNRLSDGRDL